MYQRINCKPLLLHDNWGRRAGVDTATAMQIVGHKSDKMWKRYNAIEESDLLNAAKKLNYLP